MVKIFKASILVGFFSVCAYAGQDWTAFPVGPFSGLNNRDNSYAINAGQAQDLLNVELTPGGKSVKKRKGYGVAFTLNQTTSPVHGVYDFFDANGNEVNLFFSDTKVYGSVGGATPTVLLSTAPNGATWQCTDTLGIAYCVNTSRTGLYKITGSTLSQIMTVVSTGTMITTAVDRLVMGGFSDAPARIDFSAAGDFTSWGSGSLGSSPVQITQSSPGAKITHLNYSFGRIMWFKDQSFGYTLIGNQPLQTDWVNKTVAYDVGTNDNSYVYREGILYFRGKDGHIYIFDGNTYQRLSREIAGTINQSQYKASNLWVQTSQNDWSSGFSDSPTQLYVDTNTVPGLIQTTFPDQFNSIRDGNNSTKQVWAIVDGFGMASTATSSGGTLIYMTTPTVSSGGNGWSYFYSPSIFPTFSSGVTYYFEINDLSPFNSGSGEDVLHPLYFLLKQTSVPNGASPSTGVYWWLKFTSSNTASTPHYLNFVGMGASSGGPSITTYNASNPMPLTFSMYIDSTKVQYTINGSSIIYSGSHTWPAGNVFPSFVLGKEIGGCTTKTCDSTATIDNFSVNPQTGTWSSSIHGAPNLTFWDSFQATNLQSGGTQTYGIRSATFQFTNSSTWPYTTITPGTIPSVSVSTWFQINDYFATTSTSTSNQLYDFTQNWFEGLAVDKAYATYFDDKILWSCPIGTGTTTNNRLLVYDMLSQAWFLHDIPSNGFYVKQNKLYFGSSNSGYIFKYGDVDNDNGSAINSYWKSKDFFGGDPFTTQEIANISLEAKAVNNSTMTVTYTLDGSSSTSFSYPLQSSNAFVDKNRNISAGTVGGTFNIQFGNNAADQPWEMFAVQVGIRERSWVPQ